VGEVVCRRGKGHEKSDLKGIPASGQYTAVPGAASVILPKSQELEFLQSLKRHLKPLNYVGRKSMLEQIKPFDSIKCIT
jgi:hypothetical protein